MMSIFPLSDTYSQYLCETRGNRIYLQLASPRRYRRCVQEPGGSLHLKVTIRPRSGMHNEDADQDHECSICWDTSRSLGICRALQEDIFRGGDWCIKDQATRGRLRRPCSCSTIFMTTQRLGWKIRTYAVARNFCWRYQNL